MPGHWRRPRYYHHRYRSERPYYPKESDYYPKASRPHHIHLDIFAIIVYFGVPLILIGAIVASFMGVQPLASIKDKVVAVITDPFVVDEEEIQAREHEVVELVNAIRVDKGFRASDLGRHSLWIF